MSQPQGRRAALPCGTAAVSACRVFAVVAGFFAAAAAAQDPAAVDSPKALPEGIVPTPAQTEHPTLILVGMLIVGVSLAYVLFFRKTSDAEDPS